MTEKRVPRKTTPIPPLWAMWLNQPEGGFHSVLMDALMVVFGVVGVVLLLYGEFFEFLDSFLIVSMYVSCRWAVRHNPGWWVK